MTAMIPDNHLEVKPNNQVSNAFCLYKLIYIVYISIYKFIDSNMLLSQRMPIKIEMCINS